MNDKLQVQEGLNMQAPTPVVQHVVENGVNGQVFKLLTPRVKAKVEARVRDCLERATAIWPDHHERFSEMPTIRYDIKNRDGGVAISGGALDWTIRLNLILLVENENDKQDENDFVWQVVGHEVAHLVQRVVFGFVKTVDGKIKKVRSHGPEWKEVMVKLGMKPLKYHKFDTSSIDKPKRHRAKVGAVVTSMQLEDMLRRLQNGYKRLPEEGKTRFAEWVADINEKMENADDE